MGTLLFNGDVVSYVQVWSRECLVKTVAVGDVKKHGKIHEDSE